MNLTIWGVIARFAPMLPTVALRNVGRKRPGRAPHRLDDGRSHGRMEPGSRRGCELRRLWPNGVATS